MNDEKSSAVNASAHADRSRLRHWRFENGYSLLELADLSGLSVSMLSRVERGERHLAPHTKVTVARRLGVRVSDLFDVEEVTDEVA